MAGNNEVLLIEHVEVATQILGLVVVLFFLTIITRARVYAVIFLIASYALISILAAFSAMNFIAVAILIIYMGAISVFFLFIVMSLHEQKIDLPYTSKQFMFSLFFFMAIILLSLRAVWLLFTSIENTFQNYMPLLKTGEFGPYLISFNSAILYWFTSGAIVFDSSSLESFGESVYHIIQSGTAIADRPSDFSIDEEFFKILHQAHLIHTDSFFIYSSPLITNRIYSDTATAFAVIAHLVDSNDIISVGMVLYTRFAIATIAGALLLLLAIIGVTTIFSTIPKPNKSREDISDQLIRNFQNVPYSKLDEIK